MGTTSQRGRLRHSREGVKVDVLLSFYYEACSGFNPLTRHIFFYYRYLILEEVGF